jgi:LysR family carnitine catabolism transcriptional activator
MNLTLEQLRVTVAVAEASSFSGAARLLQLTQPAVTRTVRSVEAVAGSRLFTRTTRSVELTADGIEFIAVAERIVAGFDDGLRRYAAYQRAETGSLRVSALASLAEGVLPPIVAEFLEARPRVEVRIVTGTAPQVIELLRAGQVDIALSEAVHHDGDFQVTPLGADRMHAVVPTTHPLAGKKQLTWDELNPYAFVALDPETSVRALSDAGFQRSGGAPRIAITVDSIGAAAALVAQGLGISAFPESARALAFANGLEFIALGGPIIERNLAIVASSSPAPSALSRAFADTVVAAWASRAEESSES